MAEILTLNKKIPCGGNFDFDFEKNPCGVDFDFEFEFGKKIVVEILTLSLKQKQIPVAGILSLKEKIHVVRILTLSLKEKNPCSGDLTLSWSLKKNPCGGNCDFEFEKKSL